MSVRKEDVDKAKEVCIEEVSKQLNSVSEDSKNYIQETCKIKEDVKVSDSGDEVTITYTLIQEAND